MIEPYYHDPIAGITLYCGDCRDILPEIEAVDHVITDPPYARDVYQRLGMPNTKVGSGTPQRLGIGNHQYSSLSIEKLAVGAIGYIDEMLAAVAADIARVTGRWAVVFSDVESIHLWRQQLEDGMRYVRTGAWVKDDPMPQFSGDRPCVGMEPCTIVHARGPMRWNGGGKSAIWRFHTEKGNSRPDHPCPKPLDLMLALIEDFTDPGETILDPFAGSGTTLVAAKQLGRKAIGIELEQKWCDVAVRRLKSTEYKPPLDLYPALKGKQATLDDARLVSEGVAPV